MKNGTASSLTVCMTSHDDDETTHRLLRTGEEQFSMYVEAVSILLKYYAIVFSIAKASSDTASLKEASTKTSV